MRCTTTRWRPSSFTTMRRSAPSRRPAGPSTVVRVCASSAAASGSARTTSAGSAAARSTRRP
eukprot:1889042-Prymnesium_polylepis.1